MATSGLGLLKHLTLFMTTTSNQSQPPSGGIKGNQMILFIGDFVRLHESKHWLEVTDIEPHDICVLQDGDRVCASSEYIAEAKSNSQYAEYSN